MAEMSIDNIRITAPGCDVDFKQARRLAETVIRGMVRTPRLVAWKDNKRRQKEVPTSNISEPDIQTPQDARVRVDINDNEYSFIFTETE